jgi:hypothetical protein
MTQGICFPISFLERYYPLLSSISLFFYPLFLFLAFAFRLPFWFHT